MRLKKTAFQKNSAEIKMFSQTHTLNQMKESISRGMLSDYSLFSNARRE